MAWHTEANAEAGSQAGRAFSLLQSHTLIWVSAIGNCEGDVPLLFTENETNNERVFGTPNETRYVKDGINNYVVQGTA